MTSPSKRCGKQRNDISVDLRRHLVAKNRKHNVLLITHARRTPHGTHWHTLAFFIVRVQAGRDCMPIRVSKVQNQSQRVRECAVSESGPNNLYKSVRSLPGCQTEFWINVFCTACRTRHSGAIGEPSEITPDILLLGIFSQRSAELGDNACTVLPRD